MPPTIFFLLQGKYGSYNKQTKQWDGLVRHLLDRVSDGN